MLVPILLLVPMLLGLRLLAGELLLALRPRAGIVICPVPSGVVLVIGVVLKVKPDVTGGDRVVGL